VPLNLDMTEDAVLLYGRDGFLAQILERVRASLRRFGARRLQMGRIRYSDLKPDFRPGDSIEI